MQKLSITRGIATGAALVVAIAGGASAAALATSASSSKSFQACLSSKQKTLYNVRFNPSTPPVCHRGDKRVRWNQTGPAGSPGQAGQPGADGKTVLNGSGAPATTLGTVGDFYIDTTASAIYGPKTVSGWGSPSSLVGPKGDQGSPGAPGSPGLSGFNTVTQSTGTVPPGNEGAIDVSCPSGQTAISGGYTIPFTATVLEDHPVAGNPGVWRVAAAFPSTAGIVTAYVQCATVG